MDYDTDASQITDNASITVIKVKKVNNNLDHKVEIQGCTKHL